MKKIESMGLSKRMWGICNDRYHSSTDIGYLWVLGSGRIV